ncbi:MAG: glycosyltransferase family 4 protein [Flavobacteriales bacterium]|nr:glycosyltransferase family 4 protein [Flavobacteriales bacterium]
MKVAILLLNRGRGSGVVAKEHGKYLLEHGHDVFFLHPYVGEGLEGAHNIDIHLNSPIVPVHEYLPSAHENQKAVSRMGYDEAMSYVPVYESSLEEIIDQVDIVMGHHANLTAIATANVCKRHNRPFVLFLHGTGIEPRHEGYYDDQVWKNIEESVKKANGLLVTTEYVREELVRNMIDLPVDRFIIHPCGVALKEFNPENIGDIKEKYSLPENYVICPGALTFSKGPQNVVEASKHYSDLAETIFIGDGDMRVELEADLGERGRFLGFVPNEDKAQLINAATLLVAGPEKKEHFGIIYTEAMGGGTPIVAYTGGGVNSIVSPETGILTERNPKALGESIRSLLLDTENRQAMSGECRKRATEVYASRVLGPRLVLWLERVIDLHQGTE